MRSFVERKLSQDLTCGSAIDLPVTKPIVDTDSICTVPKGNYVQLSGRVINSESTGPVWFAWDRIDPGEADYNDINVPRFVPRFPTQRSAKRFLPNLYLISYGLGSQLEEIHPNFSVDGDVEMGFRFTARTRFNEDDTVSSFDTSLAGTFGFKDMTLNYTQTDEPLTITSVGNFVSAQSVSVTWTGGTILAAEVELLIALNTMVEVADYDYETDVKDLDWISMGVFPNNGVATVTVPPLANPDALPVSFMIRSKGTGDDCFFFDMIMVTLQDCGSNCGANSCGDGKFIHKNKILNPVLHSVLTVKKIHSNTFFS